MAKIKTNEPQSAADYEDRTTYVVKSVLIEIGQILGSFQGKFAVVGGAVPWLLLNNEEMPHVGSLDVDLGLDAEALGNGEYATLVEALQGKGYHQREELRRFQLVRQVPATDGGAPIDIIVDFLMPRDADIIKNKPPLIDNFAVQRADGTELALRNILEQDHRAIKRRIKGSQSFRSFWGTWRTIAGYEAVNMIRKGQAKWSARVKSSGKSASLRPCSASPDDRTEIVFHFARPTFQSCNTALRAVSKETTLNCDPLFYP